MKIKKVLLAVIIAICTVIGCTSCGAKKIEEDGNSPSTVVVTRPDYGENIKVHIIHTNEHRYQDDDSAQIVINQWLEQNKDKTIISIEFHYDEMSNNRRYGLVIIVYRDNGTTSVDESV